MMNESMPTTFAPTHTSNATVVPVAAKTTESQSTKQQSQFAGTNEILERLDQIEKLTSEELEKYKNSSIDDLQSLPEDFKLSVIIPVYNEEETIVKVISRVAALSINKEIVVIDDCSTDRTGEILDELTDVENLIVIRKQKNEGKGAALRTGFQNCTGDAVIVQDADLEYDPSDIPQVILPIAHDKVDVVYGSRFIGHEQQDESWIHRFGNAMLTKSLNVMIGLNLTDMETCYKAFRGDIIRSIPIRQNRFGIEPEITAKLARRGYRFQEIPISYSARGYDEGKKIGIKDLFNALWCIARYGYSD